MERPSPELTIASVGATIAGRYQLVRLLGEGGMGQVFEAEHVSLGRPFALKVLRLEKWSAELVERFSREARALGRVRSARVAQVTDFGIDERTGPFFVMELLEGETLETRMERGPIEPAEAAALGVEMADALADVHAAGIVHRDLKPSNVGLPWSGPVRVKLLDFGLAASLDDSFLQRITQSHQVLGSLPYMAPEQFQGARPTPAIDLYALGVILFELLAGRLPFTAPSTAALIHHILTAPMPPLEATPDGQLVPRGLADVVKRLLEKDPASRFVTASAVRDALAPFAGTVPRTRAEPAVIAPTRALDAEALSPDPVVAGAKTVSSTPGRPVPGATAEVTPSQIVSERPIGAPSSGGVSERPPSVRPQPRRGAPLATWALVAAGASLATLAAVSVVAILSSSSESTDPGRAPNGAEPRRASIATPPPPLHPSAVSPVPAEARTVDAGTRDASRPSAEPREERTPAMSSPGMRQPRQSPPPAATPPPLPTPEPPPTMERPWTGEVITDEF